MNANQDSPYLHRSDSKKEKKNFTMPGVSWVLTVPYRSSRWPYVLLRLPDLCLRLFLPKALPSTPKSALIPNAYEPTYTSLLLKTRLSITVRLVQLREKLVLQLRNGRERQAWGEFELALSLRSSNYCLASYRLHLTCLNLSSWSRSTQNPTKFHKFIYYLGPTYHFATLHGTGSNWR